MRQKVTLYQWQGKEEGRKRFFFEKKKQKTFVTWNLACVTGIGSIRQKIAFGRRAGTLGLLCDCIASRFWANQPIGHVQELSLSGIRTFSKAILDVLSGPAVLFGQPGPYFSFIPSATADDYIISAASYFGVAAGEIANEQEARRTGTFPAAAD
jgi:hypothetical protein